MALHRNNHSWYTYFLFHLLSFFYLYACLFIYLLAHFWSKCLVCFIGYTHLWLLCVFFFNEAVKLSILSLGQQREIGPRNAKGKNSYIGWSPSLPISLQPHEFGSITSPPVIAALPSPGPARSVHRGRAPLPLLTWFHFWLRSWSFK